MVTFLIRNNTATAPLRCRAHQLPTYTLLLVFHVFALRPPLSHIATSLRLATFLLWFVLQTLHVLPSTSDGTRLGMGSEATQHGVSRTYRAIVLASGRRLLLDPLTHGEYAGSKVRHGRCVNDASYLPNWALYVCASMVVIKGPLLSERRSCAAWDSDEQCRCQSGAQYCSVGMCPRMSRQGHLPFVATIVFRSPNTMTPRDNWFLSHAVTGGGDACSLSHDAILGNLHGPFELYRERDVVSRGLWAAMSTIVVSQGSSECGRLRPLWPSALANQ